MTETADFERSPLPILPFAVALSVIVGVTGLAGWLVGGGMVPWPEGEFQGRYIIPLLYAGLALIVQGINAVVSMAARRAERLGLIGSAKWCRRAVAAAGGWNAFSLHNALALALGDEPDFWAEATVWAVSSGLAFLEVILYFIDEALKSEAKAQKDAADKATLADARVGKGVDVRHIDEAAMSDEALVKAIGWATGVKRRLEVERQRRRQKKSASKG